jgi:hypothetical protein
MPSPVDDLTLENISESGAVPERRYKDAAAARNDFHAMRSADGASAGMRARHQMMHDGEPPYDQDMLKAHGQGSRTNVNWGYGRAAMNTVMSGSIDMDVSVERLYRIPLKREAVPDDDKRFELENQLSDEVSRCIRGWEGYNYQRQNLAFHAFGHGVGIAYHPDTKDWRFRSTGLGNFVVPRGTKASEDKIPASAYLEYYELHELYDKIRDEKKASDVGWNVKGVKKAMLKASPEHRTHGWSLQNWEALAAQIRNNDTGNAARSSKVGVIHFWVQEFDGRVSTCAVAENPIGDGTDGKEGDDWLYEGETDYEKLSDAVRLFTNGIGDNGRIHSIAGILREIFPCVQALNRIECQMVDGIALGSGVIFQPKDEQSLEQMKLIQVGPMTLGPSKENGEFVTHSMPNLAQGALPVIADFRNTIRQRTGQFQGNADFSGGSERKTRTQILAELEALGKIGATQANLWYPPWTGLGRTMVKRMFRKNYHEKEPGGKEIAVMLARLKARGFPMEVLAYIDYDCITAERAIGAGSSTARAAALDQISQFAGEFDEIGRYNLLRDKTAATLNGSYEMVARYAPPREQIRPSNDAKNAGFENSIMELGQECVVYSNDLHTTHLDVHLPFLSQLAHAVDEGTVPVDDKSVTAMTLLYAHSVSHLEQIQPNLAIEQKVGGYREILQRLSEVVMNSQRQLDAEKRQAAEEGGQEGGLSLQAQDDLAKADVKIALLDREGQMKLAQKQREADQDILNKQRKFEYEAGHKDATTKGKMISDNIITKQKVAAAQALARIKIEAAERAAAAKAKAAAAKPKPKSKTA